MLRPQVNPCVALIATLALSAAAMTGCNTSTAESVADGHEGHGHEHEHEHSHRPTSLREAVEELDEIKQAVSAAIAAGDAEAAHGPLHEVGELLKAIPDVAAETDLPKEEWEAVKAASDRLFNAYAVIDKAFHVNDGDKQAAYDEVANELNEALEEIRSRLPMTGEAEEDHDHEEHDGHAHEHDEEKHSEESGADS